MASVKKGIGMCTEEFENPPIIIPLPWITMRENRHYVTGFSYLLDAGANMSCTPQNLLDFGIMARLYSQHVLGIKEPTVALVNIGEELNKGRELELDAHKLLDQHFNQTKKEGEPESLEEQMAKIDEAPKKKVFIGNAEPDPMFSGYSDIYVTDGFTGNIILKLGETMVKKLFQFVKKGIYHDSSFVRKNKRKIGGYLLKDMFYDLKATFDSSSYGGAPLLGLNTCVIKCHGRSNETAFYNAVKNAAKYVRADIINKMKEEFSLARAN
jgi:glycerol-3-phosphate acyltransferase PlsX